MSKAAKGSDSDKADQLPFEAALEKLEAIVAAMEAGDLPLETLLARFAEGTRLARVCQSKLADAELKIQQLEKTAEGEPAWKPLTPDLAETDAT